MTLLDIDALAGRARALAADSDRVLIGVTGGPGAGKSFVAEALVARLGDAAVSVGMDGFHLADQELARLGRSERKGAPDTFDVDGYVALLRRIRAADGSVYAPLFDRSLEAAVAGAVEVPAEVPIVITEGNYLLLGDGGWEAVRGCLDEVWFVQPDEATRQERLIARHEAHGRAPETARAWALGTDQRNADLVSATAYRADLVFSVADAGVSVR